MRKSLTNLKRSCSELPSTKKTYIVSMLIISARCVKIPALNHPKETDTARLVFTVESLVIKLTASLNHISLNDILIKHFELIVNSFCTDQRIPLHGNNK